MQGLTARQSQVLDLVRQHMRETGYPPTRAEIAKTLGFKSANAAEEHLRALARKGVIQIMAGVSRGIRLLAPEGLPLVGRVAAGAPILAAEHVEDHIDIEGSLFRPAADFLLRVLGDSMVNAGILHGDLLAVRKTPEAHSGQIVVARINDEVTVKRLRRSPGGRRVSLLPENDAYAPIYIDPRHDDFAIEGLGVGVLRRG